VWRAFLRIFFRPVDVDGDKLLCDAEVSHVQMRCFDDLINMEELTELKKEVIAEKIHGGVVNNCVTFEGSFGLIKRNIFAHQNQSPG